MICHQYWRCVSFTQKSSMIHVFYLLDTAQTDRAPPDHCRGLGVCCHGSELSRCSRRLDSDRIRLSGGTCNSLLILMRVHFIKHIQEINHWMLEGCIYFRRKCQYFLDILLFVWFFHWLEEHQCWWGWCGVVYGNHPHKVHRQCQPSPETGNLLSVLILTWDR